jgi:hypothetical protein
MKVVCYVYEHRRVMAHFRCGVAPIKIETGRYERILIPIGERTCFNCMDPGGHLDSKWVRMCVHGHNPSIENEMHVLLKCHVYGHIRLTLLHEAHVILPRFSGRQVQLVNLMRGADEVWPQPAVMYGLLSQISVCREASSKGRNSTLTLIPGIFLTTFRTFNTWLMAF